jgi:hypothetical protein
MRIRSSIFLFPMTRPKQDIGPVVVELTRNEPVRRIVEVRQVGHHRQDGGAPISDSRSGD